MRDSLAAAWGLIALFIAVFPANINMTLNNPLMSLWTEKKAFALRCLDFSDSQ